MRRLIFPAFPLATLRWIVATGLALSLSLAVSIWRIEIDRRAHGLGAAISAVRQQLRESPATDIAESPGPNFALRLAESSSIDPIVRELQRSSAAAGVAFVSVSGTPRAATVQTLGRTELSITLRGAYPKLKTVLAQTLDRFPDLIVQRLTMRRMATPADLEAHVELLLLARPLAAPGAGG
jgi:hypothetical protein